MVIFVVSTVLLLSSCGGDIVVHEDDGVYTLEAGSVSDGGLYFDSSDYISPDILSSSVSDVSGQAGSGQQPDGGSAAGSGSAGSTSKPSSNGASGGGSSAGGSTGGAGSGGSNGTGGSNIGKPGSYTPVYYNSPMRAVWISQWNLQSVFEKSNTAAQFSSQIAAIMKTVKDYGYNTVVVQLRPNGDSFYNSAYYPWSKFCTGTAGRAPAYDPTEIMVNEAHKQGLSFHAWFNPLRLDSNANMAATDNKYLTKQWYNNKRGDYVVYVGSYWYLNPAYPEVRQLIINGAVEIMQKYKVDALHIDDYFYPTTATSFDSTAYSKLGGGKSLAEWRRGNINTLVRGIYSAIKNSNNKIRFGISPAGNINNNYYDLYADVALWGSSSGFMDYCMPQIYFGYEHNTLDYIKCLNDWKRTVTNSGIDLVIGLGAYKIGLESDGGSDEWSRDTTILKRQVQDARSGLGGRYKGFCMFDYDSFFSSASLNTAQRNNLKPVI